jgi:hypothetical protein
MNAKFGGMEALVVAREKKLKDELERSQRNKEEYETEQDRVAAAKEAARKQVWSIMPITKYVSHIVLQSHYGASLTVVQSHCGASLMVVQTHCGASMLVTLWSHVVHLCFFLSLIGCDSFENASRYKRSLPYLVSS